MKELATVARFALFALQRFNQPMRFEPLASMIDELGFRCRKNLSFRPFLNGSTASMKNIPLGSGRYASKHLRILRGCPAGGRSYWQPRCGTP
jgi:hypothetical protein